METRNVNLLFALAAVVAISLFASGCAQAPPSPGSLPGQTGTGQQTAQAGNGHMIFTMSDAAANMGTVTGINVTVGSIMVHSSGSGWTTVSSMPKTYDLLALKASGAQILLADANLAPGTYDQVRLGITSVMVSDSNGVHGAKLPSGDLTLKGQFIVSANSTTLINFDFLADKSLHVTGNGKYILAPVIRLAERNDVEVDSSNRMDVKVRGGRMHTDTEIGMDEDGEMGEGMMIRGDSDVTIGDDGRVRINSGMMENRTPDNPSLAEEGETCAGATGIKCQPGLQCITSGQPYAEGSCTAPAPESEDLKQCPSERSENCAAVPNPVCGEGTDSKATFRDYINACEACSTRSNAIGYYMGACKNKNSTTTDDTTPPEVSQTHVLVGNSILISAAALDPSGISEITIRLSYPPESAIALADRVVTACGSSPCSSGTLQLTSGRYYYFASATDTQGNLETMKKAYFDVPAGTGISGRVLQTRSYCGGAAPPPELLQELATPKPLANKTLYIKNGTANSNSPSLLFTSDSEGRFTLALPAGAYCIVEDYKNGAPDAEAYRRSIDPGGNCTAVGGPCFSALWQQCDAILQVGSADVSNFTVQYDRKCQWSNECISWSCSLPA